MEKLINYHDIVISELFKQYEICCQDKTRIVNNFLSSLSTNNKKLRAVLPVYAIMQTFPNHKFYRDDNCMPKRALPCSICSNPYDSCLKEDEANLDSYMNSGGLIGFDMDDLLYYLTEYNKIRTIEFKVSKEDLRIFSKIITIILNADEKETIKKSIPKEIAKIKNFKSIAEERQVLLETLGYCSILETSEYKGSFTKYTNLGTAPRKTHSSDWRFPVDFWLGKDGINKKAFKFWFGEYKELEKFWK